MNELLVIVPSRGRPGNARALVDAFTATSTGHADLLIAIDDDDPLAADYDQPTGVTVVCAPRLGLAGTLNVTAVRQARNYRYVGFMGDDHRPRTLGWDAVVVDELQRLGTGVVYGNDLIQGAALPTAVFLTSDIVTALGYMVPPGLRHLFLDNFWLRLGRDLDAISYLPDVIVEHLHPIAGKAGWDDGYRRVNAGDVWAADRQRFDDYCATELAGDLAKIRAARAPAAAAP